MLGFLNCEKCTCALSVVGALTLAYFATAVLRWVHLNFLAGTPLHKYRKAGAWAVVTGASDGIGKEMAFELAKKKFNVVLVARNRDKLAAVAKEISDATQTETRVIVIDFAKATAEDYRKAEAEIDKLEVGVLINNAGINYEYPEFYAESALDMDMSMLKVNCEPQLAFTKFVVKGMVARKNGGAIVNLSSISSLFPAPMLSTYAATKAFNRQFSTCLAWELKKNRIDVLSVTPGFVCTNMSKIRRTSFGIVMPSPMVKQTLRKLGQTLETAGHWQHAFNVSLYALLPAALVGSKSLEMAIATKKRALRKNAAAN